MRLPIHPFSARTHTLTHTHTHARTPLTYWTKQKADKLATWRDERIIIDSSSPPPPSSFSSFSPPAHHPHPFPRLAILFLLTPFHSNRNHFHSLVLLFLIVASTWCVEMPAFSTFAHTGLSSLNSLRFILFIQH